MIINANIRTYVRTYINVFFAFFLWKGISKWVNELMKVGVQEDSDRAETGGEFARSSTWDKHSTAWTLAGELFFPLTLEGKSPWEAGVYLHRAPGSQGPEHRR